jgi:gamma-D-glutamyl-L-lysine dipeptidyl-peptidase
MEKVAQVKRLVDGIRQGYAPDPRTAVFEIQWEWDGGTLRLTGATSEAAAAEALHREVALLDGWSGVENRVVRLPHTEAGAVVHALARSAVVPLLAGPEMSQTHVTQVVLGHRLTVLRRRGRWMQCRSEDGYLGWVHRGYLSEVSEADARGWEMGTGGEACVSLGAEVQDGAGETVARLPWGARVVRRPDGSVALPDGAVGHPTGTLLPLYERAQRFPCDGDAMVATAARWHSAPYLWGGVTPAGVDCSGLVQAVLGLHGITLPRDSDQQARTGEPLDPGADFAALRPGDLLFFAEAGERISHVALSMGGSRIIHSSLGNGGVRRNDLLGALTYEQELRALFVCARRHL